MTSFLQTLDIHGGRAAGKPSCTGHRGGREETEHRWKIQAESHCCDARTSHTLAELGVRIPTESFGLHVDPLIPKDLIIQLVKLLPHLSSILKPRSGGRAESGGAMVGLCEMDRAQIWHRGTAISNPNGSQWESPVWYQIP